MKNFKVSLSALAFAGAIFNPATFSQYHPPKEVSIVQPASPLLAAVGSASDPIGLDTLKDSVFRIGVELGGTLRVPPSKFDKKTNAFVPSNDTSAEDEGGSVTAYRLGSGFVVDPSGYLITNAHVVDTENSAVIDDLWDNYQQELWYEIADALPDYTEDEVTALSNAYLDYVSEYGSWEDTTYNVVVFNPDNTGVVEDITTLMNGGWNAEIKKTGNPYPQIGKDIAIIKINSDRLFVPITLGDSTSVTAGSSVYVIGYPTVADVGAESLLTPTVTSGIVSAIKDSDLGNYKVIQVDANIAGGNSGGPVINKSGQVVGVATFGASESDGYNWALPIELAKEYLNELNITPKTADTGIPGFISALSINVWAAIAGIFLVIICGLVWVIIRKRAYGAASTSPVSSVPPQPLVQ